MRFVFLLVVLVLGGLVLLASFLVDRQTLSASELDQIQQNCLDCHTVVLRYGNAQRIHDLHPTLSCTNCHSNQALPTALDVHSFLQFAGIGLFVLSFGGITSNYIVVKIRKKKGLI
jgi:hypothetical protein